MAKFTSQSIPSLLLKKYTAVLTPGYPWKNTFRIKKRAPFKNMKQRYAGPEEVDYKTYKSTCSSWQRMCRAMFKRATTCWRLQPKEGGVEPPEIGPRNRSWWWAYATGSGMWYYNYFMQKTIGEFYAHDNCDWCPIHVANCIGLNESTPDEYYRADGDLTCGRDSSNWHFLSLMKRPAGKFYVTLKVAWISILEDKSGPFTLNIYYTDTPYETWKPSWNNQPTPYHLIYTVTDDLKNFTPGRSFDIEVPECYAIVIDGVGWPSDPIEFATLTLGSDEIQCEPQWRAKWRENP